MDVSGKWTLRQSTGHSVSMDLRQLLSAAGAQVVTGLASYDSTHGRVDGTVDGVRVDLHVYWQGNVVGRYQGTRDATGRLAGTTYDVTKPASPASWISDRTFS